MKLVAHYCGAQNAMKSLALVLLLLLVACSNDRSAPQARAERKARIAAAAEAHESKPPVVRSHSVNGNQLLIIDVPVVDAAGSKERQRCFVWREQGLASISCPQPPDLLLER